MLVHALVEAPTQHDALVEIKAVFDRLVGANPHDCAVFNYYCAFDKEDTAVAGKARWANPPTAVPVDSEGGGELLDRK